MVVDTLSIRRENTRKTLIKQTDSLNMGACRSAVSEFWRRFHFDAKLLNYIKEVM